MDGYQSAFSVGSMRGRWGRLPPTLPPREPKKYFKGVSENKSSDRKLICTFWYSRIRVQHYTECINTAASGDFAPRPSAGSLPPAYPLGAQPQDPRFVPQHELLDPPLSGLPAQRKSAIPINLNRVLKTTDVGRYNSELHWPMSMLFGKMSLRE